MSELKCNCGRATHAYLSCGPDLPTKPYDGHDELTRLRAENAQLREAISDYYLTHQSLSLRSGCQCRICKQYRAALAGEDRG